MRKIALMSDYLSGAGGTEYYTATLASSLQREGNDVRVYTGPKPKTDYWTRLLAKCGVQSYDSGIVSDKRWDRKPEAAMVSLMLSDKGWQPDIVHANPFGKMAVEWILARFGALPLIATEWTIPSSQTRHWYPEETAELINQSDVIIATCEASAKGLREEFKYQGRCEVIP